MASIKRRNNTWTVIYGYKDENGKSKKKWEGGFKSEADALARKKQIEDSKSNDSFIIPTAKTLADLIDEYVEYVGLNKWAHSTFTSNKGYIRNYINPIIGHVELNKINKSFIRNYYNKTLLNTPAVGRKGQHEKKMVSPSTVREINKILNPAFDYAVEYEYFKSNPAFKVTLPKSQSVNRAFWDYETFKHASDLCENEQLHVIMHIGFACSLRIGEILGLTWDDVDISEKAINSSNSFLHINKQLQRVSLEAMKELEGKKEIIRVFPPIKPSSKSRIVLVDPKTEGSNRIVWLPKSVAMKLVRIKKIQDSWKNILGDDYIDYNQVFTRSDGNPTLNRVVQKWFDKLIFENKLPKVVFHSLRHTSTTYKLKLYKDVKAVQGDTGHSQTKMITDVYSHVLDEDRRSNAEIFEKAFYQTDVSADVDLEKLVNLIDKSPEIAKQIMKLLESMDSD